MRAFVAVRVQGLVSAGFARGMSSRHYGLRCRRERATHSAAGRTLVGGKQSFGGLVEDQAKGRGDARAIGWIGLGAVGDVALLDLGPSVAQGAGGVLEQQPLLPGAHLAEQNARL